VIYLLDTCVLSETMKKKPSSRVIRWLEKEDEDSLFLSVITFGELRKGISKLARDRRRKRLEKWVDEELAQRFFGRILPVDMEVARRWGEISSEMEMRGQPVPVLDSLLAATALEAGLTLVTRNIRHVERTGVSVLDPWEPPSRG
jgi:predicted nucleic acid-binding protein